MEKQQTIEEHIKSTYTYDPETGKIFWKAKLEGKETFKSTVNGYLYGKVLRKSYLAHRVAWLIHYGEWPKADIDHVNGVKTDNRLCNLRDVPPSVNMKNTKRSKRNMSGVLGVTRKRNRWLATIKVDNRRHRLGSFTSFEEAVAARKAAEEKYGFHKNHGRD